MSVTPRGLSSLTISLRTSIAFFRMGALYIIHYGELRELYYRPAEKLSTKMSVCENLRLTSEWEMVY